MLSFIFKPVNIFGSALLLSVTLLNFCIQSAFAQSSNEETTITRGVGFRQSNKFEFKYKERIKTYEGQIDLGLKRGWLSAPDAKTFSERLAKLKEMEASVSANGYQKPELDNLELEITKFNREFSDAGQKTKASPLEAKTEAKSPSKSADPKTTSKNTVNVAPQKPMKTRSKNK
ncbi:MAG: hypothetical protein SFY67_10895 [Candidatus Melainabacteria bacterium]|nr:hypothetical protein [Candidatus Melainabacteria bacterium]